MIRIEQNEQCCGCEACVQVCPKSCISFDSDAEGFRYPLVDEDRCINCELCEKVCPVIHQGEERKPQAIYAAKNPNEDIRRESSSGGIFTMLAEEIIRQGGVVFGARWNERWEVVHDYVETSEELALFRGSKYVQSRIGDNYTKVRTFLREGRQVLFSGTPCQVAGLKRFLRKEYENLLTVDFICHGVPSPGVWERYKDELLNSKATPPIYSKLASNRSTSGTKQKGGNDSASSSYLNEKRNNFKSIRFRDKSNGWKRYLFVAEMNRSNNNQMKEQSNGEFVFRQTLDKNIYMRGFLRDLYLRPSCHACPSKSLKSGADITIADFWGIQNIHPEFDDDRGASLVIVNSEKGAAIYDTLNAESIVSDERAFISNPSVHKAVKPHKNRSRFFSEIVKNNSISIIKSIESLTLLPFSIRAKIFIIKVIRKIIGGENIKRIKTVLR